MHYDKHMPVYIDDFQIHLNLKQKLNILSKNDISNILLYGLNGSGKLTIAKCLINSYYKQNIITKKNIIKINAKELKFISSDYHFEIILNKYFNKKNFNELLKFLCSNNEINNKCNFKLILIKNIEYIDNHSLLIMKNILEKNRFIKFILISNTSNLNTFFKGFFLLLKIPKPKKIEVYNYLNTICKHKIDLEYLDNYVNLNTLFPIININTINNYNDPYEYYTHKLIKLISSTKVSNINKIRDIIYELLSKGYDIVLIYKNIYKQLLKTIDDSKKYNLIELYSNININKSFKSVIHIEALIINIMNIIV